MEAKIGLSKKELTDSVKILTELLGSEMVLTVKTRNFHWNIKGRSFMEFHKLLDKQYDLLNELVDLIAERISKLGGTAVGIMKDFIDKSELKETSSAPDQTKMLSILLEDQQNVAKTLRDHIEKLGETKDFVTTDFLTGVLEKHEDMIWEIRSYLS